MEKFIKFYVLVSLWFWAGMLLSAPLRRAFEDMHWRMLERIYNATLGQVVKFIMKIVNAISQRYKKAALHMEDRTYEVRVKIARSLLSKELIEDMGRKDFVSAISRARQMDQGYNVLGIDEYYNILRLIGGEVTDRKDKEAAARSAFKLSDTVILKDIIARVPRAQERILLAFEQAEGDAPYDSVKNEEYRKFIRE